MIGSDAATTCVIALLWHPGTRRGACVHFDGGNLSAEQLGELVAVLFDAPPAGAAQAAAGPPATPLHLHLVGAFEDAGLEGRGTLLQLLNLFLHLPEPCHLVLHTALVGPLNTRHEVGDDNTASFYFFATICLTVECLVFLLDSRVGGRRRR